MGNTHPQASPGTHPEIKRQFIVAHSPFNSLTDKPTYAFTSVQACSSETMPQDL